MRFVSTYSLNEAGRGYPRILEYQVIPGENGTGVRLIVNEFWYCGPLSAGSSCVGVMPDPVAKAPMMIFRPVQIGPSSFVLADKLALLPVLLQGREAAAPTRPMVRALAPPAYARMRSGSKCGPSARTRRDSKCRSSSHRCMSPATRTRYYQDVDPQ